MKRVTAVENEMRGVYQQQAEKLKEMEGVAGVHIMAIEWEEKVAEIAEKAGLLPRPTL